MISLGFARDSPALSSPDGTCDGARGWRRGARRGARGGRAASSTVPTPQQSVTDPIYLAPPLPSYVHPVQRAMPVVTAGSS
jgi:hypothetical protein